MNGIEVEIITPPVADDDDPLDAGLVALTEAISHLDDEAVAHGCLGGEFGYGAHWDNAVFTMRPYYWGDCDCGADEREEAWNADPKNRHSPGCYQSELRDRQEKAGIHYDQQNNIPYEERRRIEDGIYDDLCAKHSVDRRFGAAVHCTCEYQARAAAYFNENGHRPTCALELPNFLHKRTGLEVRWYKWIGRGMECVGLDGVDVNEVIAECLASLETAS